MRPITAFVPVFALVAVFGALAWAPSSASAQAPEVKEWTATQIAEMAYAQEFMGMSTGVSQVRMTLINKKGETRVRRIQAKSADIGGKRHSLVRFLSPPDVQGTSFLLIERGDDSDDQYLYLPALKRVRRIAGSQRNASFMGSDFSYADMESRDVTDSAWTRHPDEKVGPLDCYKLQAIPKEAEGQEYRRSEIWVHKETWLPVKMKLYDKKTGTLQKTLFVEEFKKIEGRWIVTKAKMANEAKKTATRIEIEEIKLDVELPVDVFSVEALSKG